MEENLDRHIRISARTKYRLDELKKAEFNLQMQQNSD